MYRNTYFQRLVFLHGAVNIFNIEKSRHVAKVFKHRCYSVYANFTDSHTCRKVILVYEGLFIRNFFEPVSVIITVSKYFF